MPTDPGEQWIATGTKAAEWLLEGPLEYTSLLLEFELPDVWLYDALGEYSRAAHISRQELIRQVLAAYVRHRVQKETPG